MPSFSQRKSKRQADASGVSTATRPPELSADLARYRRLANELAVQRKSVLGDGPHRRAAIAATGRAEVSASSTCVGPGARVSRANPTAAAALIVALVSLAAVVTWLQLEGRDVKAAETAYAHALPPDPQSEQSHSAVADPLPFALEAALITSTTQAAALADLRLRVQQAEALSDSYAARLAQEQVHRRSLEEALAAYQEESLPPGPSVAPSPGEAGRPGKPPQPTEVEALPPAEQVLEPTTASAQLAAVQHASTVQAFQPDVGAVQPTGEPTALPTTNAPQPTAELVQPAEEAAQPAAISLPPAAEPVRPTAEPVRPTAEPLQPMAESLEPKAQQLQPADETHEPTAETHEPTAEPLKPAAQSLPSSFRTSTPALPAAVLDRLMVRARELREQGDIAAARIVLEGPADSGHGPALFQLAETYDPNMLSAWRTLGTKGDVAKARHFYGRAEEAGVAEATKRLESLPD